MAHKFSKKRRKRMVDSFSKCHRLRSIAPYKKKTNDTSTAYQKHPHTLGHKLLEKCPLLLADMTTCKSRPLRDSKLLKQRRKLDGFSKTSCFLVFLRMRYIISHLTHNTQQAPLEQNIWGKKRGQQNHKKQKGKSGQRASRSWF